MGKIGLDGVLGGQLCSWTEKHGEKSCMWAELV